MDKEEFKCLIVNQFKDTESAVYDVLYRTQHMPDRLGLRFLNKCSFFSRTLDIDARLELIATIASKPVYQIIFEDLEYPIDWNDETKLDVDDASAVYRYFVETIKFIHGVIEFNLETYEVVIEDNLFKKRNQTSLKVARYDIMADKFIYEEDCIKIIKSWEDYRCNQHISYVDYVCDSECQVDLTTYLGNMNVRFDIIYKITTAFSTKLFIDKSRMMAITLMLSDNIKKACLV